MRTVLCFTLAVVIAGCAVPAGGSDSDLDATNDLRPPRQSEVSPTPTADPGQLPANDPAPPPPPLVACAELGIPAWGCASFESGAWGPAWTAIANSNAVVQVKQPKGETAFVLQSLFHQIPADDRATLGLAVPPQARSVALRFSFRAPTDGYPARVALGGLVGTGGADGLVFALHSDKQLTLDDEHVTATTRSVPLGSVVFDRWTCVELELGAAGTVRAWAFGKLQATFTVEATRVLQMARAEIGLTHRGPANQAASVIVAYDDVVVAPSAIGCR